jgi:hypothetical protein
VIRSSRRCALPHAVAHADTVRPRYALKSESNIRGRANRGQKVPLVVGRSGRQPDSGQKNLSVVDSDACVNRCDTIRYRNGLTISLRT